MAGNTKEIINRKAKFEYHFLQGFEAGIMLTGTEVKSMRTGDANLNDAYCLMVNNELYIKSMFIAEYSHGNINNHATRRDRKLLIRKSERNKIDKKIKEKGFTLIPYRAYFSERGHVKVEIFLAQGKQGHDKRQTMKERDSKRDLDRIKKEHR